jgi:hypothetical protein
MSTQTNPTPRTLAAGLQPVGPVRAPSLTARP